MKLRIIAPALLAAVTLTLVACERTTAVVPVPTPAVVVPGPAGAPGAPGPAGAPGKTGDSTTVIVTPPAPAETKQ
jgi:hypothetical protein